MRKLWMIPPVLTFLCVPARAETAAADPGPALLQRVLAAVDTADKDKAHAEIQGNGVLLSLRRPILPSVIESVEWALKSQKTPSSMECFHPLDVNELSSCRVYAAFAPAAEAAAPA